MNFEPQKFFIGLLDFFSILLPGALLTYLLMGEVGPVVLGHEKYQAITGAEGVAVFIVYLLGRHREGKPSKTRDLLKSAPMR